MLHFSAKSWKSTRTIVYKIWLTLYYVFCRKNNNLPYWKLTSGYIISLCFEFVPNIIYLRAGTKDYRVLSITYDTGPFERNNQPLPSLSGTSVLHPAINCFRFSYASPRPTWQRVAMHKILL